MHVEGDEDGTTSAVLEAHRRLLERGLLSDYRLWRAAVAEYLAGNTANEASAAVAALDVRLLACHGVLIEDLPAQALERWRGDPYLLLQPDKVAGLREDIYGDNPFPIPRNPLDDVCAASPRRRQLVVEQQTQRMAVREYIQKQVKLTNAVGAAAGCRAKHVWTPWADSIARIISQWRTSEMRLVTGRGALRVRQLLSDISLEPEVLGVLTCQAVMNQMLLPNYRRKESSDPFAGDQRPVRVQSGSFVEEGDVQVPFVNVVCAVGEAVLLEDAWQREAAEAGGTNNLQGKHRAARLMQGRGIKAATIEEMQTEVVPIGSALVALLLEFATVEVERERISPAMLEALEAAGMRTQGSRLTVLAFAHSLQRKALTKSLGYLVLRSHAKERMDLSEEDLLRFVAPKNRPMLVEPRPWKPTAEHPEGGFLMQRSPFIRTTDPSVTCLTWYCPQRVMQVMDSLGKTPWRINRRVLEVMEEVKRRDLAIGEVPPAKDPHIPEWDVVEADARSRGADQEELTRKRIEHQNMRKRKQELQSERPTFELKLQVARDFVNAPRLYFPHNVDFRGRAYPVPPHLNHISDDICRGLLTFAESKPLGKNGFFWLKVQLANLLGKNKIPFSERVALVDAAKETILAVAADPLAEGSISFWSNADDGPWQALACCFELAAVWKSGDEEGYLCSQPVHLDGSCNGLQHYAALGRDEAGGKAVNLTPSDRPQDVYTVVLGIVKAKVEKHAGAVLKKKPTGEDDESDDDEAERQEETPKKAKKKKKGTPTAMRKQYAERLVELGVLQRKVVKQTIMTICYGVTTLGARKQVQGQLEDMVGDRVAADELKVLAAYLSGLVLKSIDEVFERAMKIKNWFDTVCAMMNDRQRPTSWLSPIGLACVQPYKEKRLITVMTKLQSISLADPDVKKVHKSKQRMGFPPNFIHSLDATHMMLVAIACERQGLTFAGVHDSFWTHAATAPELNVIIREAFIELHSRPILEEFREDLIVQFGGVEPPELPDQGALDIQKVRESPYIFH